MGKKKSTNPVGGLGVRYGVSVRKRTGQIVTELRKKHRCQSCGYLNVRRISVGLWKCMKCNLTFSGGAYLPYSSLGEIAKRSIRREI